MYVAHTHVHLFASTFFCCCCGVAVDDVADVADDADDESDANSIIEFCDDIVVAAFFGSGTSSTDAMLLCMNRSATRLILFTINNKRAKRYRHEKN